MSPHRRLASAPAAFGTRPVLLSPRAARRFPQSFMKSRCGYESSIGRDIRLILNIGFLFRRRKIVENRLLARKVIGLRKEISVAEQVTLEYSVSGVGHHPSYARLWRLYIYSSDMRLTNLLSLFSRPLVAAVFPLRVSLPATRRL